MVRILQNLGAKLNTKNFRYALFIIFNLLLITLLIDLFFWNKQGLLNKIALASFFQIIILIISSTLLIFMLNEGLNIRMYPLFISNLILLFSSYLVQKLPLEIYKIFNLEYYILLISLFLWIGILSSYKLKKIRNYAYYDFNKLNLKDIFIYILHNILIIIVGILIIWSFYKILGRI